MGNLGLLVASFASPRTALGRLRAPTLSMGLIALAGSVLFFSQQGMGIGVGGMERVAAFPLQVWVFCVGAAILAAHPRGHAVSMGTLTRADLKADKS